MNRFLSGTRVAFTWAAFNTVLASVLAGFTASGTEGSANPAGAEAFVIYASSAALTFLVALAIWAGRRRVRGISEPPHPASMVILAVGVAMAWTSLAFGAWAAYLATPVVLAALIYEFYPRIRP
jgi:hypothetical protein